jgi:hypothetical protein
VNKESRPSAGANGAARDEGRVRALSRNDRAIRHLMKSLSFRQLASFRQNAVGSLVQRGTIADAVLVAVPGQQ